MAQEQRCSASGVLPVRRHAPRTHTRRASRWCSRCRRRPRSPPLHLEPTAPATVKGQAAMTSSPCSRQVAPASTILPPPGSGKSDGVGRRACLAGAVAGLASRALPVRAAETPVVRLGTVQFGTAQWAADVIQRNHLDVAHGFALQTVMLANTDAARVAVLSGGADIVVSDWFFVASQRAEGTKLTFAPFSSALGGVLVRAGFFADPVAGRSRQTQAGRGGRPTGQVLAGGAGGGQREERRRSRAGCGCGLRRASAAERQADAGRTGRGADVLDLRRPAGGRRLSPGDLGRRMRQIARVARQALSGRVRVP